MISKDRSQQIMRLAEQFFRLVEQETEGRWLELYGELSPWLQGLIDELELAGELVVDPGIDLNEYTFLKRDGVPQAEQFRRGVEEILDRYHPKRDRPRVGDRAEQIVELAEQFFRLVEQETDKRWLKLYGACAPRLKGVIDELERAGEPIVDLGIDLNEYTFLKRDGVPQAELFRRGVEEILESYKMPLQ